MVTQLEKYKRIDSAQLRSMITSTRQKFPYLEFSSIESLIFLCQMMISVEFMSAKKVTPIRSSFEFLRIVSATMLNEIQPGVGQLQPIFTPRDFVFAIKMFGLYVRGKNNNYHFVPEEEQNHDDSVVDICDSVTAQMLEYCTSDICKRTKIQIHGIDAATNRLQREWHEIELASIFAALIKEGKTVGQSRTFLFEQCGIKAHEFVRIRAQAINRGLFISNRKSSKASNRQVTLDDDVALFVGELSEVLTRGAKPLTMSQATNKALRDFKIMLQATSNKSTLKRKRVVT